MTRVGRLVFGVLVVSSAGGAVCNGQAAKTPATVPTTVQVDTRATITYEGGAITVAPMIAVVTSRDPAPFRWLLPTLPAGHTLEIDIRVEGGRKGPFPRPERGSTGRYVAQAGQTEIVAGIAMKGRAVYKYDVIVRDASGNDVAAIDPMIIDVE